MTRLCSRGLTGRTGIIVTLLFLFGIFTANSQSSDSSKSVISTGNDYTFVQNAYLEIMTPSAGSYIWFTSGEVWGYWDGSQMWGRSENITYCQAWLELQNWVRVWANVTGNYYIRLDDLAPGKFWISDSSCLGEGHESDPRQISAGGYSDFWIMWDPGCCSNSGPGNLTVQLYESVLFTDPLLDTKDISFTRDYSRPDAPTVNPARMENAIGLQLNATDQSGSTASGIYGYDVIMDSDRQLGDGEDGFWLANPSGYCYAEFSVLDECSQHSFIVSAVDNLRHFSTPTAQVTSTLCCSCSISPTSRNHSYNASSNNTISVAVDSGCHWSASESLSWLTITSGSDGNGDGTVTYSVTENTSTNSRQGNIIVDNLLFTVSQDGKGAYSISGQVTLNGSGLSSVVMNGLPGTPTPITDGNGSYSTTISSGWSGTATPYKTGYAFTPPSRPYNDVTVNQTSQNYTASITTTYTISGQVTWNSSGLSGVVMNGLPGAPTTDGGGNYSVTVSYDWSGTVTPSKTGYAFTPTSRQYNNVISNQTGQNYTAAATFFTVSGQVTWNGSGLSGVVMNGFPGTPTPTTDSSGIYSATVEPGWRGRVTPSKADYAFTPPSLGYVSVTKNLTNQNYTATATTTYAISGQVTRNGSGLSGVVMNGLPSAPTTDVNGYYSATVFYGWSGVVTPSKLEFVFTPPSRTYSNLIASQTNQNYIIELIDEVGSLVAMDPIVGNLRYVPAGTFTQGRGTNDPCNDSDETPFSHTLTQDLAVMETEVTQEMWDSLRIADTTLPFNPSNRPGNISPVESVTWYEAILFANRLSINQGLRPCYYTDVALTIPVESGTHETDMIYPDWNAVGYRLPTEGEWEYFCRAGAVSTFSVPEPNFKSCNSYCTASSLPSLESTAWFCANSTSQTHPAGEKIANPWNLRDLHGNVWEWCWDWYSETYPTGLNFDYRGAGGGTSRVRRGGGVLSYASSCRSANRSYLAPGNRNDSVGFRLLRPFHSTSSSAESVTPPNMPAGPSSGQFDTSYTFSVSGSSSNLGHSVQYFFDWGDGSDSGWLPVGTTSAGHSWTSSNTFCVKAKARCSSDSGVESAYSSCAIFATPIGPDGKIAYASGYTSAGRNYTIWVMNPDGTGQTQLKFSTTDHCIEPAWSPDGTKIAFTMTDNATYSSIYIINTDGTGLRNLTNVPGNSSNATWSPNGSMIALSADFHDPGLTTPNDIYLVNVNGNGVPINITNTYGECEAEPCWSPDGNSITFISDDWTGMQNWKICMMNADGSGRFDITDSWQYDYGPEVSPDCEAVVFHRKLSDDRQIYKINIDGSGLTQITTNTGQNYNPCWSPSGQKIALQTYFNNYADIYIMNVNGTDPINISNHQLFFASIQPDWIGLPSSILIAPSFLHPNVVSENQIDLSWRDNSYNESDFHIERSPNGNNNWTEIAAVVADTTFFNNSGLNSGTPYYYRIRAHRHNDNQYSGYSNIAGAVTPTPGIGWIYRGPGVGNIVALTVDPANPSIVYARAFGSGVFKSTNGGGGWLSVNSGLTNNRVVALAIDPASSATMYVGTFGGGIFKSTNGSANWSAANSGIESSSTEILSLAIDPSNTANVYAGTNGDGVFKSTNKGENWTRCGWGGGKVLSLAVDPTNTNVIYAGTFNQGVLKSTDRGGTWNKIDSHEIISLAINPASTSTVFIGTYGNGALKSTNGGNNWTEVNSGLTSDIIIGLAFDPTNSSTIFAGTAGGGAFKSTNGGGNWVSINSGLLSSNIIDFSIDPTHTSILYAGSAGGGSAKSTDGGQSWTALDLGCTNSNIVSIAIDPTNSSNIYAGSYGGGVYKSTDRGSNWMTINSGLTNSNVFAVTINPINPSILYAGTFGDGVFKSTNGGDGWAAVNTGLSYSYIQSLAIHPVNGTIMYAGTFNGPVFKTTNGGGNWIELNVTDWNSFMLNAIAIDPLNPSTVYLGTGDDGIFKSTDSGISWTQTLKNHWDWDDVTSLAIDQKHPSTIYAGTYRRGIIKSTNGGLSWTLSSTSAGLTNRNVLAIVVHPVNPATLYAGTAGSGVFWSGDGSTSWKELNTGLTAKDVRALVIDPVTGNDIYSGTSGGGVFSLGIPSNCKPSKPANLTAEPGSISQINLGWVDTSNNETGFRIERKTENGGSWAEIATTNTGATSFQNMGLATNTTFFYRVRAYNGAGNSDYSNEASAMTSCPGPIITVHPQSTTISSGQTTLLSVIATGTAPLSYQWYQGSSPSTTNLISGATSSTYTTPALTATTSYWVKVTNICGFANSNTATITVTPCQSPAMTAHPQSTTILSGQTAPLSVTATGTAPLGYQWYQGSSPSTTNPISGATNSTYTTLALTATTSYWVKVTNVCGTANSNTATITVNACTAPSITAHPQSTTVSSGQTAPLSVTATGTAPLGYQWYQGSSPSTINPISGATNSSYTTPALTATTSYWVKVANICNVANSTTATITVTPCQSPVITVQPLSQTISSGQRMILMVQASGNTPMQYSWYQGLKGDISTPASGAANSPTYTTPILAVSTNYWVRVLNACNSADSETAAISVTGVASLAEAVDSNLLFGTYGNSNWTAQTAVYYNDNDAAKSGIIAAGQKSVIDTVVTGPGTLSYYWKISSQTSQSCLRLLMDDLEQAEISGEVEWQQRTHSIPAGAHTVKWEYYKEPASKQGQPESTLESEDAISNHRGTGVLLGDEVTGFARLPITSPVSAQEGDELKLTDQVRPAEAENQDTISAFYSAPNLRPYQPTGWSDKIVVSKNTGTSIDDTTLTTNDILYIDFAVDNNGDAATSVRYYVTVYKDGAFVRQDYNDPPQESGWYHYWLDRYLGKLSAGNHTIKLVIDPEGYVSESNESDNEYTKTITVSPVGTPDLIPFQPSGWSDKIVVSRSPGTSTDDTNLTASDDLYIDNAVINNGDGATTKSFYNAIFVDNFRKYTWVTASPLNPAAVSTSTDYNLGKLGVGPHNIQMITDNNGDIHESIETNNLYEKIITISNSPPTDSGCLDKVDFESCQVPVVTDHPQDLTISSGQTANLDVTATGTAPLAYQWYLGASPSTTNPISGATNSGYNTPALTTTTSYWVKVTNNCGLANSNTATITVNPCAGPSITVQPASQPVLYAHAATLTVTATGTPPLHYAWYRRDGPNDIPALGAIDAPMHVTPPLESTSNYWVRVYNECNPTSSTDSTIATLTVNASPAAPMNLSATAASSSQVNLSWEDKSPNETLFKIERKAGAAGTWAQVATAAANAQAYGNTGLPSATTYFYRVRASNAYGDSVYSNEAYATPGDVLAAPANLVATAVSSSQVNLTWADTSTVETGFRIDRKTGQAGTWAQVATAAANATAWNNSGLAAGTSYIYRVCALTVAAPSGWSNEAPASTYNHSGNFKIGGYLGVGTMTPERAVHLRGSNAVFRMDRSLNSAAFMLVRTNALGTTQKAFTVGANSWWPTAPGGEFVINDLGQEVSGGGIRRLTIDTDGNARFFGNLGATGFYTPSSMRFKENIHPFAGALDRVLRLNGVRFDWKETGTAGLGLIAEDTQSIFPEVVAVDSWDGAVLGIEYGKLSTALVETFKDQGRRIEILRRQRDELKALLQQLDEIVRKSEPEKQPAN